MEQDETQTHKKFSSHCFNQTWKFLDMSAEERSPQDEDTMLMLAMTSAWHWTQRPDFNATKASISHWQISRAFVEMKQADMAVRFAKRCLHVLEEDEETPQAWCVAYAYEALARAFALAENPGARDAWLQKASELLPQIEDEEIVQGLEKDLASIA